MNSSLRIVRSKRLLTTTQVDKNTEIYERKKGFLYNWKKKKKEREKLSGRKSAINTLQKFSLEVK